ncbi:hypothetical protein ACFWUZ_34600 [Streptomyces sp. NPDC058646]|uniref:hypothetical protein n=1 Tax=Streptomyces sp. NPDC058646 TaxID=3346574 RepID=UPI00364D756E
MNDQDWHYPWPLDRQRHHRILADLVDADGILPDIASGVLMDGDDIGKWLQQQKQPATWHGSCLSSRSDCPRWPYSRLRRRLPSPRPVVRQRVRARRNRRSNGAWRRSRSG